MKSRAAWVAAMTVVLVGLWGSASAGEQQGATGEWRLVVQGDGWQMPSVLVLSRDEEGKPSGEWISLWGVNDLEDVRYKQGKLVFTWTSRFGDQEMTSEFAGTIKDGEIAGALSGERGEYPVEGRHFKMPAAAGIWEMQLKMGERTVPGTLTVERNKEGKLVGRWASRRGQSEISNLQFEEGVLTFQRTVTMGDRQSTSKFEGTVEGKALSGTFKSERGTIEADGKRADTAIAGTWDLAWEGDTGTRSQVLKVYPDLSGRYGPIPLERVQVEGEDVAFNTQWEMGDRKMEIAFDGTVAEDKLTGEITTPWGARKVTGKKRAEPKAATEVAVEEPPSREPDVIFVPTPQPVVDRMLELAEVTKDDVVYDLGCGDGRIVVTAAKEYGCRGVGYDIDPERVKESRENVEKNGVQDLVRIEQKDIFTLDLSEASVITLYLLPDLNVKLIPQLQKLRPGCRIVSHDFAMRGVEPEKVVEVGEGTLSRGHNVYLWRTPLQVKP